MLTADNYPRTPFLKFKTETDFCICAVHTPTTWQKSTQTRSQEPEKHIFCAVAGRVLTCWKKPVCFNAKAAENSSKNKRFFCEFSNVFYTITPVVSNCKRLRIKIIPEQQCFFRWKTVPDSGSPRRFWKGLYPAAFLQCGKAVFQIFARFGCYRW